MEPTLAEKPLVVRRVVAWLAWVPNALFVEWIIRRGWRRAFVLREGFAARSS